MPISSITYASGYENFIQVGLNKPKLNCSVRSPHLKYLEDAPVRGSADAENLTVQTKPFNKSREQIKRDGARRKFSAAHPVAYTGENSMASQEHLKKSDMFSDATS